MPALHLHPTGLEGNTRAEETSAQSQTPPPAGEAVESESFSEANDDRPFADNGLPVPETYDLDIVRAMVQDPFRVFVYWDIRQQSIEALTRGSSANDGAAFQTTLKLIERTRGNEAYFDVEVRGGYWMAVIPGHEYEFEIGVRSANGYISLIRSNCVRTPHRTVSTLVADEAEYRLSPKEFIQVLEASGFSGALASESMPKPKAEHEIVLPEAGPPVIMSGRNNWQAQVIVPRA